MKTTIKTSRLLALGLTSLAYLASPLALAEEPAQDKSKDSKHEDHDHADHEGHDHDEHEGHDHAEEIEAPNGGRIMTDIEPHAEFLVTKERKVQITFLDDEGKALAPAGQTISVICGQRSAPTRLKFEVKDGVLISDKALPEGKNIPTVIQAKVTPESKTQIIRFDLNLEDCPTCDYLEYACTCDHGAEGEEGHEGHDH